MAEEKCGLKYCGATVADYDYAVDVLKCPCLKCFGTKSETCNICKQLTKLHADAQKMMCSRCQFYNGR